MSKNRDLANNYDNSVVDAKLNKADNLSDLPNIVTARTNLGLSTGATGTVTTSATDTTAGRLLKVGDNLASTSGGVLAPTTGALTVGTNDASSLTFKTNNANRVTVSSAGNVGIGTTSPSAKLDVAGGSLGVSKVAGRTYNTGVVSSTNPNIVNGSGFNSIPVQVGDTITFHSNQVRRVVSVTDTQLVVDANWTVSFAGTTATGKGGIGFNTDNTERVRITPTGNVGIGTTSPSAKLDIVGTGTTSEEAQLIVRNGNGNYGKIQFTGNTDYFIGGGAYSPSLAISSADGIGISTAGTRPITFSSGALRAERTRITSTGNLLIGTTTDNGVDKLQVNGDIRGNGAVKARADVIYNAAVVSAPNTTGQKIQVKLAYPDPTYVMPTIEVKGSGQSGIVNFMTRAYWSTGGSVHNPSSKDFAERGMTATWYYSSDNKPCVELHYPPAGTSEYLAVSINYIGVAANRGAGRAPNISATFSTTRY